MSQISLNSISVNHSVEGEPLIYVGSVVNAKSGYLQPKLIKSIELLETAFGEFKYDQMYKMLIERDLPVCLLPVLTGESKYNVCSLRLTNLNDIVYCHPKKDKYYTPIQLDTVLQDSLESKEFMYGMILDFTNVSYDELSKIGSITNFNDRFIVLDLGDFYSEDDDDYIRYHRLIASGDYVDLTGSNYNTDYDDLEIESIGKYTKFQAQYGQTEQDSIKLTLQNIKDSFNGDDDIYANAYEGKLLDLKDLILESINRFFIKYDLPEYTVTGEYVDLNEWVDRFIDFIYIEDFWIENNENVVKVFRNLFNVMPKDILPTKIQEYLIQQVKSRDFNNLKLLFRTTKAVRDLRLTNIEGLVIESCYNLTHDQLSKYTDRHKVVEFYSKIKGPAGDKIKLDISKLDNTDDLYTINITNGLIYESYIVYLYDLDSENHLIDSIHITDISDISELVEVYCYNYWLNNELIDDRFYNIYDTSNPYDENNRRDISELKLPLGSYELNRYTDEVITESSIISSLEVYKKSDWYPDLFLIDELAYTTDIIDTVLEMVDITVNPVTGIDPDNTIASQALINLSNELLNSEYRNRYIKGNYTYPSDNNRLLYFYGEVLINGYKLPCYFPYIFNLLTQQYLEYPSDLLIYDPFKIDIGNALLIQSDPVKVESITIDNFSILDTGILIKSTDGGYFVIRDSILYPVNNLLNYDTSDTGYPIVNMMEYLTNNKVNFLKYDNLTYFYEYIYEQILQPNVFMIRYVSSKFTREIYKIRHQLTGIGWEDVSKLLNEVCSKCISHLNYVTNVTTNFNVNIDTVSITFEITMPKLINKPYKLNFTLNV